MWFDMKLKMKLKLKQAIQNKRASSILITYSNKYEKRQQTLAKIAPVFFVSILLITKEIVTNDSKQEHENH